MTNPTGHIVFDCDGTLISTMEGVYQLYQEFIEEKTGLKVSREELVAKLDYDVQIYLAKFGITGEAASLEMHERWTSYAKNHESNFLPFPGIVDLLEDLKKEDYALYVWTGRDRASTVKILNQLDLMKYFEDISCRDDCETKPNTMGLIELLGVNSANELDKKVVVVGDSYADILGAVNFKAIAIGALWCENVNVLALKSQGADVLLEKPSECLDFILSQ
ncbi:MAG: phosphoglycolate phosphatase [Thermoproteota archaeon]|jgi:phosphoglycolate phosphatase